MERDEWYYLDRTGAEFGPFKVEKMRAWFKAGFFPIGDELLVRQPSWSRHERLYVLYPNKDSIFSGPPRLPAQDAAAVPSTKRAHVRSVERSRSRSPKILLQPRVAVEERRHAHRSERRAVDPVEADVPRAKEQRVSERVHRPPERERAATQEEIVPRPSPAPSAAAPPQERELAPRLPPAYPSMPPPQHAVPAYVAPAAPPVMAYGPPHAPPPTVVYVQHMPPPGYAWPHAAAPELSYGYGPMPGAPRSAPPVHYAPAPVPIYSLPPPAPGYGPLSGAGSARMVGRVKSFNVKAGFGFVDCKEAHHRYGRDVFIHKQQIGDLEVGDEISFTVDLNKDGFPQAREVMKMDGSIPRRSNQRPAINKVTGSGPQEQSKRTRRGGRGRRKKPAGQAAGEEQATGEADDAGDGTAEVPAVEEEGATEETAGEREEEASEEGFAEDAAQTDADLGIEEVTYATEGDEAG
mmetsp:Transcript_45632/g.83557  ORF Transcript_45632/g.83557 Transcript_45632/m.83557 type:complete len:464 (-) Transcript_45632:70-1461(-)